MRCCAPRLSLYALLVKVFPETFDAQGTLGRIYLPLGYWNAIGLIAALGVPACLWAGARRERARAMRALAVPSITVLVTVVILSYSRSALLAMIVGVGCWFAFVPLRLRGALVLGIGLAGAARTCRMGPGDQPAHRQQRRARIAKHRRAWLWDRAVLRPARARSAPASLAAYAMDRTELAPDLRRRIAMALVTLVALLPLAGVVALAASSRGFTGEISHAWNSLTTQNYSVSDTKNRIGSLESSRSRATGTRGSRSAEHALLKGVGALGYGTARTRYTHDVLVVQHAHSYVIETLRGSSGCSDSRSTWRC